MESLKLRKPKFPKGKSVRINLKLSNDSLNIFDKLKASWACKTNTEVFDHLCVIQEGINVLEIVNDYKISEQPTRKTFTINEYALAKLRNLVKDYNKSSSVDTEITLDEYVDQTLYAVNYIIDQIADLKKCSDEKYVLGEINDIWSRISSLRYGLEKVFDIEYDTGDPENLNCWFADIENGLQEIEELVKKFFKD